ncbi:DNA polymerase III epsilon subunit [Perkinsela sp. CCAP 1560/4]|nr:DNA polymerase III epsilon subunit [Perkinsela sp. CCAP 1560/4]|eukprot:KNH06877.1 DNA polymerase III epsilon subunit [Perkinsela sp. CCAP 1560/4]
MVTLRSKRIVGEQEPVITPEARTKDARNRLGKKGNRILNRSTVSRCRELHNLREDYFLRQLPKLTFPIMEGQSHACCCTKCVCNHSLADYMNHHRVVIVDTETTGVTRHDQIIEIGAVEVIGNHITGRSYHAHIKPTCRVHPMASRVHGLKTDSIVLQQARGIKDVFPEFMQFVADSPIVCHNTSFDMRFLRGEGNRVGTPFEPARTICTLRLFRSSFSQTLKSRGLSSNLDSACTFFEISGRRKSTSKHDKVYHNALEDASLTAKVYAMLHRLGIVHLCAIDNE